MEDKFHKNQRPSMSRTKKNMKQVSLCENRQSTIIKTDEQLVKLELFYLSSDFEICTRDKYPK